MNPVYELNNVGYAYAGKPVLSIDRLQIKSHESTAIVGPNGSGKSTLLNILAFINFPAQGSMQFQGREITRQNFQDYRRQVGYVQQKPYLFHLNVFENIEIGLKLRGLKNYMRRQRVEKILDEFAIKRLAGRYAHHISGGEAQKVAIARSLVLEPDVLILDEPFSHVDSSFRDELEELLRHIIDTGRTTVIFTTHDQMQAAVLGSRIYTLVHGHLVPVSTVNMFRGKMAGGHFDTGRIRISVPPGLPAESHIAVDSNQIVLSREKLESSMQNSYVGRITGLSEENGLINMLVQAGEKFNVLITNAALQELGVNIGDKVWLSFKSTSVHLF